MRDIEVMVTIISAEVGHKTHENKANLKSLQKTKYIKNTPCIVLHLQCKCECIFIRNSKMKKLFRSLTTCEFYILDHSESLYLQL